MSRLRKWLRTLGKRTQRAMPEAMQAIHRANAAGRGLQSYPVALGSPDSWILRQGRAARFNRRWYFVHDASQRLALEQGEAAVHAVRRAIERECERHRVEVRFANRHATGTTLILL